MKHKYFVMWYNFRAHFSACFSCNGHCRDVCDAPILPIMGMDANKAQQEPKKLTLLWEYPIAARNYSRKYSRELGLRAEPTQRPPNRFKKTTIGDAATRFAFYTTSSYSGCKGCKFQLRFCTMRQSICSGIQLDVLRHSLLRRSKIAPSLKIFFITRGNANFIKSLFLCALIYLGKVSSAVDSEEPSSCQVLFQEKRLYLL